MSPARLGTCDSIMSASYEQRHIFRHEIHQIFAPVTDTCSVWLCLVPLSFCVSGTHTNMHTLANKCTSLLTPQDITFLWPLSVVWTAVHIHLFGISVIDVFFLLPLGLKQYAVQGLCMLMCPLTPAGSNYPWGMEPRLGLQPPAIIWVMAKLHKSFIRNWKKKKKQ